MGAGHLKVPKEVVCATCGTSFLGLHYSSKYCKPDCEKQNHLAKQRLRSKNRGYGLWRDHKLTYEQFEEMAKNQNYQCAICNKHIDMVFARGRTFHVDHCHTTNQIRGLLCMNCNTGLGQFKDDTSVLQNAIDYLTKFKELKRVKGV